MTVKSTVRSAVRSAIRGTVRGGGGELLPEWTHTYDGLTTFAEYYTNFTPTGSNSTLEIAFYKQGAKIQTIAFGDASAFSIALDASDVLTFNLISNVELNGVPATSGVTAVPDGYYVLTGDLDITSDVKYYAANATPANFFGIQIHSMRNLDNYDTGRTEYPVNGRDVVELDGLTQYGEIPAWRPTSAEGSEVHFDFIAKDVPYNDNESFLWSSSGNDAYARVGSGACDFGGSLRISTLDGEPANNSTIVPTDGKVHSVKAFFANTIGDITYIGARNILADLFGSSIINLRLTDLDNPGNSRYYPLDRADIIQDVNGDGSTDGNWINAPQEVHRLNNSIDINTIKRSKDAPSASDNKLVNSLNGQEVGSITNLTGYELVNRGE